MIGHWSHSEKLHIFPPQFFVIGLGNQSLLRLSNVNVTQVQSEADYPHLYPVWQQPSLVDSLDDTPTKILNSVLEAV